MGVKHHPRLRHYVRYPFFLAYANGCPAYIPTDRIIKEGGHEGKDAMPFFGHHHPFKVGAEQILYENLHAAFRKLQSGNQNSVLGG